MSTGNSNFAVNGNNNNLMSVLAGISTPSASAHASSIGTASNASGSGLATTAEMQGKPLKGYGYGKNYACYST